ncbi:hypothetical protein QNA24_34500 [Rhodococcus qingshengii]|nr:hypothetical protein [Rhodococcus qingshengii]MDJ0491486.1 hypothetical protein [Rhodococcus qingshengii]
MIDAARTAALAQPIALAGEATTAALIQQAVRSLILLTRKITDLDKQITGVLRRHRHACILESVPGIGTRSATTAASARCSTWLRSTAPSAMGHRESSTNANVARNDRPSTR